MFVGYRYSLAQPWNVPTLHQRLVPRKGGRCEHGSVSSTVPTKTGHLPWFATRFALPIYLFAMTVFLGIGLSSPSPDAVYGFNTMIALGVLITGMILWRKMNKLNAEKDEYLVKDDCGRAALVLIFMSIFWSIVSFVMDPIVGHSNAAYHYFLGLGNAVAQFNKNIPPASLSLSLSLRHLPPFFSVLYVATLSVCLCVEESKHFVLLSSALLVVQQTQKGAPLFFCVVWSLSLCVGYSKTLFV